MDDAVLFDDLNGGRLMIFKIHIPISVGIGGVCHHIATSLVHFSGVVGCYCIASGMLAGAGAAGGSDITCHCAARQIRSCGVRHPHAKALPR